MANVIGKLVLVPGGEFPMGSDSEGRGITAPFTRYTLTPSTWTSMR
jgi:formylglycine-generating enzyme required for sulfatase activity